MELNGVVDPVVPSAVIEKSSRAPAQERERIALGSALETLSKGEARSAAPRDAVESVLVHQEFPPNTRLHLDEESNRIVAQVLDDNNQGVRQSPSEELRDISVRFNRLEGILFDEQR
jgi:hypothetical protein